MIITKTQVVREKKLRVFAPGHMRGDKIQIFKKRLLMQLYPVLHCRQVEVHRKINSSSLVTTMYSGGIPKVSIYFFLTANSRL